MGYITPMVSLHTHRARIGLIFLQGLWARILGINLLAVIACFMFPRHADVINILFKSHGVQAGIRHFEK